MPDFEIDFHDILPRGSGRLATAFLYIVWAVVSIAFIGSGFFQNSTLAMTIHIAAGSLFLLALLFFIAVNVMTAGKPGCVLLAVQNGVAMVLAFLGVLLFIFGLSLESLLTEGL